MGLIFRFVIVSIVAAVSGHAALVLETDAICSHSIEARGTSSASCRGLLGTASATIAYDLTTPNTPKSG